MKKTGLLILFLIGLLYSQAQDITGAWYGRLAQVDLSIAFHINEKDGSYTTEMDSPD